MGRLREALRKCGAVAPDELLLRVPTVEALFSADLELLARQCGLDHGKLQQLAVELACQSVPPARTARELHSVYLAQNALLSTGIGPLDALLRGGLLTGEVCEVVGPPGSGKTAICLMACAAQAEATGSTLFVDTANAFRASRLNELLKQQRRPKPCREDLLMHRLRVACAPRLLPLVQLLEGVEAALDAPEPEPFYAALRLVVVDSIFSAVVAEGAGASKSAAGAQVARLQQVLRRLATRRRLALLVTNLSVPGQADAGDERAQKPALGTAWQHTAHVRLQLCSALEAGLPPQPAAPQVATVVKSTLSVRGVMMGERAAFGVGP